LISQFFRFRLCFGDFQAITEYLGHIAAVEEVALPKTSGNTRPGYAEIKSSHRAFLQFLHHNHIQPPLASQLAI
jgi:hypothetical protein